MATLAQNAAAVKAAQVAIDAAIVAKGGTTTGGLSNAATAIAAIPSGAPNQGGTPDDGWKNDGASHFWNYGEYDGWTFQIDIGKVLNAQITIAWGDGQSETLNTSSSNRIVQHVYSKAGAYRVDVTSGSGGEVTFGNGSSATIAGVYRTTGIPNGFADKYTHIELGSNADQSNGYSQCSYMTNLRGFKSECVGSDSQQFIYRGGLLLFCSFGEGWTGFNSLFNGTPVRFKRFVFPRTATSVSNCFYTSFGLEEIDFSEPSNVTALSATFRAYSSLRKCFIPASVQSVASYTFDLGSAENLEIHFRGTVPPTVTASNAFSLNSTAKIFVPYSADHSVVAAYKAAPNLSVFADQIFEEEI